MIPVYIASSERFACAEWLTEFSIKRNTRRKVDIKIIRPEWRGMSPTGCTGFTNVRYSIPELLREDGYEYGIYLDVDMLVLGDIGQLWNHRQEGKWVGLVDGSTEVAVIHKDVQFPAKNVLHRHHKSALYPDMAKTIPMAWNCEDYCDENTKILHFTDLNTQPWFTDHPNGEVTAIYEDYCEEFIQ